MKVLVLGGNGFIGSHVVRHLLAHGHDIRVFGRYAVHQSESMPGVDYRLGDFGDVFQVAEALIDIDVVCHLITSTVPGTSNLDPAKDVQANLINTIRLLEQMRTMDISRIVFLSSGGTVYGIPAHLPIHESHSLDPICSYGVVKVAIEKYLHMYEKLYGFKPLILRPSNPYGPGQAHLGVQGLIGTFLGKILKGKPLDVWGDGNVVRDYIYIDDLACCVAEGMERESTGVFNVGSGQGYSVNEVVNTLRCVVQSGIVVNYHQARPYDVPEVVLDIEKAKQTFDWQPGIDLQQGIRKHFEWLSKSRSYKK